MTPNQRTDRSIVVMCMPETGHFRRLRPLIHGLAARGIAVHVFTHRRFAPDVERARGQFHDMFEKYPLDEADATSLPAPCRFVTYAAHFGEAISRDVSALNPSLIIHGAFTVIGRVVATRLGIPRVNVCTGHNVAPERYLAMMRRDTSVRLAPECLRAVEMLRDSYGMVDASPFCYLSSMSPLLNVYCEPPEFLDEEERRPFAPIAFFGSIASAEDLGWSRERRAVRRREDIGRSCTVYIAFGTVIWRTWQDETLRLLDTMATELCRSGNVRTVIGLGGASVDPAAMAALSRPGVVVESFVDQWQMLQRADVFITHQGLNSTHEAIFHETPMISHPFFWDQPALAAKCQRFGVALPLVSRPRGRVEAGDVRIAMDAIVNRHDAMHDALARAREWELAVIEQRPAVLKQIVDLMQ